MVGYLHISFLRWVNQAWMCQESGIIIEKTDEFGAAESGLKSSFRWDEFFNIIERALIFHSSQIFSKFNENYVQCFIIENQAFYSIFGRNRNIWDWSTRLFSLVLPNCPPALYSTFRRCLSSTLISTQVKAQRSFQWFLIVQCRSDIPHISIMFQALDLEDTFTLPMIHRYTLCAPPPPLPH